MLLLLLLVLVVRSASGFECEFPDRRCGWRWSDAWTLLTAENTSALGQTAPESDAENNVKGELLYFSPDTAGSQSILKVSSPLFEANTLPTCAIRFALHMYQMDEAVFKMVIKAPNSTWESTAFSGNSHHKWENQTQPINVVTQPFSVMIEILNPSSAYPAHVAIDNIEPVDCYHERSTTTDCTPRQFQCDDLICVDAAQVCDLYPDCIEGEDEDQDCDKIPASAYCTFERNVCGWNTSFNDNSNWIQRRGLSPNSRTGPSSDHTFQNSTGTYMVAKFPSGRVFGFQTTFTSPWFMPPPYYHRNVHSPFYNSCQVRFFYHKFGHGVGDLRLYSLEADPANDKVRPMELWRSYGNKGDTWWKAIVTLPNISHPFQLEFLAVRGTGNSDIAIDDVSLSPECFGIGVPESESRVPPPKLPKVQKKGPIKYIFNTCGAEGRIGPTQSDCFSAYRNSITKIEMMEDKVDMKGIQKWTVPQKGLYTLFVKGAGGGPGVENRGKSLGTSLRATFEWEEGQALYILVGQKGVDACRQMKERCDVDIGGMVKRSIESLRVFNNQRKTGGAGGGGGATYVFQMEGLSRQKVPLAIAGGGGGLASRKELNEAFVVPHGLMPNNSILPINGYTGSAAGGGGGWDDKTSSNMSGMSLREGGRGGEACDKTADYWNATGGFGGGGGSCLSGGGGGGYRGGDASDAENNDASYNGQGGTSYLMPGSIRVLVEPGSNPGDGSVVIMPAQKGCGCEHLCVYLDVENKAYYCICPPPLTLSIDGFSCDGNTGVNVSPKILIIIIIAVVITISVVTICILFATARYRKLQRSRDVSNQPLNSPDEQLSRLRNVGGMVSENNPNYEFGGNTWSEQDLKKIPRENLTLLHGLGQGAFGEVYEGTLKNTDDNEETPVAVKTLPEISSNQAVFDFLMEALIMSKFNHPNIVSFIGVCFDKMPRFIILELLQGGDLKSFLRECRPKPNVRSSLTITDLLKLAVDVAHGCQYLEENHFIHRDIAARNCLLTTKDADRVVKIADFGMARDIYRADYYRKGGKAMLPIKWMPPEAFLDGVFTTKTDVWSYGILLWELISLGYMPYPGRGNQEVMQLIMSGGRLEPPTNCPSPIYHIMMQCWHPHPDERPNFTTIIERLGYCMQDPDVINSELPVFRQAPSMERDATVMRPQEMDKAAILQVKVQRQDPGLLLSPGSEDYLIPTPHSSYSLNTEVMSGDSADQLLEMEERGGTPSSRPPSVWETNFMTPETPTEPPGWGSSNCIQAAAEEGDVSKPSIASKHSQQNGQIKGMDRASSSSLDDLPLAPELGTPKQPLDPSALLDSAPQRAPYGDLGCAPRTTFDGFSGVNPVA